MSLRVTDVQAALRRYASLGHDVTTDPRMVHLDGKRYGMALGHTLEFTNDGSNHPRSLYSSLMQSERPLISGVFTGIGQKRDGLERVERGVTPHIPTMHTDYPHIAINLTTGYTADFSGNGAFQEHSVAPEGSLLWTPDWNTRHKDIHEALEAHKTSDVSHTGLITDEKRSHAMRKMTPREMAAFDHTGAMERFNYGSPLFKGIVNVRHNGNIYQYHPDTEQLFEHHA